MAFSATNKAPGVYIDEIQLPGPIAGVGTSTAAFVGPALAGPIGTPEFLTNWTEFAQLFGLPDVTGQYNPYMTNPDVFVTHAVRGFIDNGGTSFYFVRVSNGKVAWLDLNDSTRNSTTATLRVKANTVGSAGNSIQVQVLNASIVPSAKVANPPQLSLNAPITLPASSFVVTLAKPTDAAQYVPGDLIQITDSSNQSSIVSETVKIASISSTTTTATFKLASNLTHAYTAAAVVRLADLAHGQNTIRFDPNDPSVAGIEPGTYLTITQGQTTENLVVAAVQRVTKTITLSRPLQNTYSMAQGNDGALTTPITVVSQEFSLVIGGVTVPNLSLDPRHSRYFLNVLKLPEFANLSATVNFPPTPNPTPPPNNLPAVLAATPLANGQNESLSTLAAADYNSAIDTLQKLDDVNLLCVPDVANTNFWNVVQPYMIAHCEKMQDRFAILDPASNAVLLATATGQISIQTQLQGDGTAANPGLVSAGGYGALYFPRIQINHPLLAGQILTCYPSGHLAGMFANVDNTRGVWKAPANQSLVNVLAVETILSDNDQGPLNEMGINVLRFRKSQGVVCWGARTISTSTQWRYVSTRRLLLFIEKSLQQGTQFAVFEPNEIGLWKTLSREITDFLMPLWQRGALFGDTAAQAFRVRIDEELNPAAVRALGQIYIEVVVIPSFPAEFVVFRIIQDPTGSVLQES